MLFVIFIPERLFFVWFVYICTRKGIIEMSNIASFIRFQRKKLGLTQEELATKAGVGIRFVRELEQGKITLRLDKVEQVLRLFGFELTPSKQSVDPYYIFWNYLNKGVKITLSNKLIKYGIIIAEITDKKENKIVAWKFVANNNAILYQQKSDDTLTETIIHAEIIAIENQ
jgi:y4mF family transcriptional regulator